MANDQKINKKVKNDTVAEKVTKKVEEEKKPEEDFKSKYLRALADYQNFEKRVNLEKEQIREVTTKNTLLKLLPFLDNLEKAELFVKDSGLKMVKDNFYKSLKDLGLEEVELTGKVFDPYTAEAIDIVEGKEDNKIVEVLRKGYSYKGNILRVAQVKVSKKVQN